MDLFEIVLLTKKDWDRFSGLKLEPFRNKGLRRDQKQAFSLRLNNNLSKIEWISYKFYYKEQYHKRKTGIDFWACDLSQIRMWGSKGARNKFVFLITGW